MSIHLSNQIINTIIKNVNVNIVLPLKKNCEITTDETDLKPIVEKALIKLLLMKFSQSKQTPENTIILV